LPDAFQQLETNQTNYGNTFEGGQNLSFTNLLALPLEGSSGEGFLPWNAENWGLGNMLPYVPWGNTLSGEVTSTNGQDPMSGHILNTAVDDAPTLGISASPAMSVGIASKETKDIDKTPTSGSNVSFPFPPVTSEPTAAEVSLPFPPVVPEVSLPFPPVASEVSLPLLPVTSEPATSEVSLPFPPIASEVSPLFHHVASEVALEVDKTLTGDEVVSSEVQQKRTRKPTTRGEIVPLTTKEASLTLPEWFVLSQTFLEDGLDVNKWRDCMQSWIHLEKALGLSKVGSVSSIIGIT